MHGAAQVPTLPDTKRCYGRGRLKIAGLVLTFVAATWMVGCGIIYREMCKPPEEFGRFMTRIPAPVAFIAYPFETMWMHARGGSLKIGDAAPEFSLFTLHSQDNIRLSKLNATQPVVLVFGSYT